MTATALNLVAAIAPSEAPARGPRAATPARPSVADFGRVLADETDAPDRASGRGPDRAPQRAARAHAVGEARHGSGPVGLDDDLAGSAERARQATDPEHQRPTDRARRGSRTIGPGTTTGPAPTDGAADATPPAGGGTTKAAADDDRATTVDAGAPPVSQLPDATAVLAAAIAAEVQVGTPAGGSDPADVTGAGSPGRVTTGSGASTAPAAVPATGNVSADRQRPVATASGASSSVSAPKTAAQAAVSAGGSSLDAVTVAGLAAGAATPADAAADRAAGPANGAGRTGSSPRRGDAPGAPAGSSTAASSGLDPRREATPAGVADPRPAGVTGATPAPSVHGSAAPAPATGAGGAIPGTTGATGPAASTGITGTTGSTQPTPPATTSIPSAGPGAAPVAPAAPAALPAAAVPAASTPVAERSPGAEQSAVAERGRGRISSVRGAAPATGAAAESAPTAATPAGVSIDAVAALAPAGAVTGDPAVVTVADASVPTVTGAADRVVAEAMSRIRTTVKAGVPALESRVDDPQLGSIRILVSARPGETIHAELVARDPMAARELAAALDRAFAAGASLPGGVDLHVRAEALARPSAADAHLASGQGHGRQPAGDGQLPGDRRHDDPMAFAFGGDGGNGRPEHDPTPGRERRPGPTPVTGTTAPHAVRSGAALDVRA